jgi:hypothetical protein
MSYEVYAGTQVVRMKAGAAVVKSRALKPGSAVNEVIHAVDITDLVVGVALNSADSGDWVSVQIGGIAKMEAAEAITVWAEVMVQDAANDGSIAPAAGATARSLGVALVAATADGDIIPVQLRLPTLKGPPNS